MSASRPALATTTLAVISSPELSTTPRARPSRTRIEPTSAFVLTCMPKRLPESAIASGIAPMPPRTRPEPPAAVSSSRRYERIRRYAVPAALMLVVWPAAPAG